MATAVVVTGASRSFGRCLALEFAREVDAEDLDLVRRDLVAPITKSSMS